MKKENEMVLVIKNKATGKEYTIKNCDLSDRDLNTNKKLLKGEKK